MGMGLGLAADPILVVDDDDAILRTVEATLADEAIRCSLRRTGSSRSISSGSGHPA
jgi:DNA-binding response OmpR family regulator